MSSADRYSDCRCAGPLAGIRYGAVLATLLLLPAITPAAELPSPDLSAVEPRVRAAIEKELATAAREPDSPSTWGRLAMTLHAHQFDDEAAAAYTEASRLAPGDFRWFYLRANVEEASDPAAAAALYRQAVELDRAYAPARIRLASALEKVGLAADADEHYREATRLEPDNAVAHLGLGRLALARGDVDQATRHLERAHELSPETQAVVAMLSRARPRAGARDGARRLAQAARDLPPLLHQRDPRRAEVDLLAMDSESFLRRSKTYRETGQLQASLGELRRLIELEPGNAQAHFAAAGVHDRMNRPQEAVAAARRALELDPDLAGGRAVLAGALFKLGQFGEAAAEAERVLAEDPADIHMLLVTTMLAMRENDVARALERLDRAAGVGASDTRMRDLMIQLQLELAEALGGVGLYDDAARRIEQVVETLERAGAGDSELQPYRRRLARYRERARG
ncbi:MAG: tetratricopeptide repeat protein [Holophagales bacterium]|nr:tetratricopeptide repeat protein [Holophagales bacterium]